VVALLATLAVARRRHKSRATAVMNETDFIAVPSYASNRVAGACHNPLFADQEYSMADSRHAGDYDTNGSPQYSMADSRQAGDYTINGSPKYSLADSRHADSRHAGHYATNGSPEFILACAGQVVYDLVGAEAREVAYDVADACAAQQVYDTVNQADGIAVGLAAHGGAEGKSSAAAMLVLLRTTWPHRCRHAGTWHVCVLHNFDPLASFPFSFSCPRTATTWAIAAIPQQRTMSRSTVTGRLAGGDRR